VKSDTVCLPGGTVHLTASGGANCDSLIWYSDAGLTNRVNVGTDFMPNVTATTSYYVVCKSVDGCVSPAARVYARVRSCIIGNIFPTGTTCSDYINKTAVNLDSACYQVKGLGGSAHMVSNAQPGVMFYYVQVTIASFPATVVITETVDNPAFRFMTLNHGHSWIYSGVCTTLAGPNAASTAIHGNTNATFTYHMNSGTPGVYIFSLQISIKSMVGGTFTGGTPNVNYCYSTSVNGGDVQGADCINMKGGCTGGEIVSAADMLEASEEQESTPAAAPVAYALHANFPNPFNPSTVINYDLPEQSTVKLAVYNLLGQEVATLVNGDVAAGYQTVQWNATNGNGLTLPSGVYMYRLEATSVSGKQYHEVRKMLFMK
jgi:hypothetical protein